MRRIVLATKNQGKIREIRALLGDLGVDVLSLDNFANVPDVVEDGTIFFENALKKAKVISEHTGEIVLADDSGLEVEYLGGEPGVYSSRYSGPDATDETNIKKLLYTMGGVARERRRAAFRCVLVLYFPNGKYESFEGRLEGIIHDRPVGGGGFGYDPVLFLPDWGSTVAQLPMEVKNRISHRAQAVRKFKEAYIQKILSANKDMS
ncbi:MAG: XTP/dITP diphosphatase [Syntrophales bacterium]